MEDKLIATCHKCEDFVPKEISNKIGSICAKVTIDGKKFEKALKNLEIACDNLNKAIEEFTNKNNIKVQKL